MTKAIDKNEPNSLGWGFYNSNEKIILIERYLNAEAMMEHAKNISVDYYHSSCAHRVDIHGHQTVF